MARRYMNFNIINTLNILLNILGHDFVHDYRETARWIDSIVQLNFLRDLFLRDLF